MQTQTFMIRLAAAALYLAGAAFAAQAGSAPAPELDMEAVTESVRQQLREELRCQMAERHAETLASAALAAPREPLRLAQHCELPASQS